MERPIQIEQTPFQSRFLSAKGVILLVAADELKKKPRGGKRELSYWAVDTLLKGRLAEAVRQRRTFKGANGTSACFEFHGEKGICNVMLFGWNATDKKQSRFDRSEQFRKLGAQLIEFARSYSLSEVCVGGMRFSFPDGVCQRSFVEGVHLARYEFLDYRSKKEPKFVPSRVIVVGTTGLQTKEISRGKAFAQATAFARDLVNTPPRDCTPRVVASEAKRIAKREKLACKIFDRKALSKLGAGILLSVTQGSDQPPFLARLEYKPRGRRSRGTIALVGKGVTFDSGGYSLKPPAGMETMKCDMSGAAAVLATMSALRIIQPSVTVRGYIPLVENMVNGSATKPGDVFKGMNGTTVEILNTDAEGRLILSDTMTLAQKDGCDVMIDLATLTGACVVALGDKYAGMFTDDDDLARILAEAGSDSGERFWRMPLAPEYKTFLTSTIADIKNVGPRFGGAITAALFLKHFVQEKTRWAHLDIAGPAFNEGGEISGYIKKGGVGFGVRTLLNYLMSR